VNLWNYESRKLLHSIDSGHSANIFCNKFVPETSDELVVTGAADAEVRLFNLSRIRKRGVVESALNPSARFQCHSRRVKKLAEREFRSEPERISDIYKTLWCRSHCTWSLVFTTVIAYRYPIPCSGGIGYVVVVEHLRERDLYMFLVVVLLLVEPGNPSVVWSASEDGTLRQHDFRETTSCSPADSSHRDCRNVLLDLRCGAKKSLADPPRQSLVLKSCDINMTRPYLLLVGGSDAFARLYDRRMLSPLSASRQKLQPPPCVNYYCPTHLSDRVSSS
ncbi:WD and tetratricopeptide repeats protein 1 isoform X2, partial [Tanacetum coccineum]